MTQEEASRGRGEGASSTKRGEPGGNRGEETRGQKVPGHCWVGSSHLLFAASKHGRQDRTTRAGAKTRATKRKQEIAERQRRNRRTNRKQRKEKQKREGNERTIQGNAANGTGGEPNKNRTIRERWQGCSKARGRERKRKKESRNE